MGLFFQIPQFCPNMISGKGFNLKTIFVRHVDLSLHYQLVCRTRGSIKSIQLSGIHSQNHTLVSPLHWDPFIINILLFLIIINSSSFSSSASSSSATLRPKMGQWSFRSRCQICKKLLCTGPRCSTGDQMFLLLSIQMVKLVSSGNHNISHDDNYYGAHWEKRVGTSVPFFSSRPKVVPKSSQSSPKSSSSIPYLVLRKSQSSSQAFSK